MRIPSRRPQLRIELPPLGLVDPFALALAEEPPGSGQRFVTQGDRRLAADLAGLNAVGAAEALFALSTRWLAPPPPDEASRPPRSEAHLALRPRDARLLASLLRRHLRRLPQPPAWMPELMATLDEILVFLRWEG